MAINTHCIRDGCRDYYQYKAIFTWHLCIFLALRCSLVYKMITMHDSYCSFPMPFSLMSWRKIVSFYIFKFVEKFHQFLSTWKHNVWWKKFHLSSRFFPGSLLPFPIAMFIHLGLLTVIACFSTHKALCALNTGLLTT